MNANLSLFPNGQSESKWDLNDKYLRLKKKTIKKLISLPPKYLNNLNKGIEESILKLNQDIYEEFNGIPIEIGKKSLLQNVGTSIDDHPYIQFYVNIECVVFTPKIDKKVIAVVNKIGETYVGCLICDRINATIFKRYLKPQAADEEEPAIQNQLKSLTIGQSILIKIKDIKYEKNDLFIIAQFVKTL